MPYAWVQDLPITLEVYREIMAEVGQTPPPGLILHVAQMMEDGHLQYLDMWESEAACERFVEERLHAAVGGVLRRHGIRPEGGEPPRRVINVTHVWAPPATNSFFGTPDAP